MNAPQPTTADMGGGARSTRLLVIALPMALAGVLWLVVALSQGAGAHLWLAGHLVILATGVIALQLRNGSSVARQDQHDMSGETLVLFATAVLGPVGTVIAALAAIMAERHEPDSMLLAAWYRRISDAGDVDRVTRLATAVTVGRSILTETSLPSSYEGVIADGTMVQRQNALGLIARRFAPDYAPALKAALISSEPVVRVQAAAVAVKIKAELTLTLDELVEAPIGGDPQRAAEMAAQLDAIARTGLLDAADAARAAEAVARFVADASAALAPPGSAPPVWISALSPAARSLIEDELLRKRRFGDFRAVRNVSGHGSV